MSQSSLHVITDLIRRVGDSSSICNPTRIDESKLLEMSMLFQVFTSQAGKRSRTRDDRWTRTVTRKVARRRRAIASSRTPILISLISFCWRRRTLVDSRRRVQTRYPKSRIHFSPFQSKHLVNAKMQIILNTTPKGYNCNCAIQIFPLITTQSSIDSTLQFKAKSLKLFFFNTEWLCTLEYLQDKYLNYWSFGANLYYCELNIKVPSNQDPDNEWLGCC